MHFLNMYVSMDTLVFTCVCCTDIYIYIYIHDMHTYLCAMREIRCYQLVTVPGLARRSGPQAFKQHSGCAVLESAWGAQAYPCIRDMHVKFCVRMSMYGCMDVRMYACTFEKLVRLYVSGHRYVLVRIWISYVCICVYIYIYESSAEGEVSARAGR